MVDFIIHDGFRWEFESFGRGNHLLLAFHGFGNHGTDFRVFETALGDRYSIVSFTLPHHSREVTTDAGILAPGQLEAFVGEFVKSRGAETFSLMGYSLGGKIVMQLIEQFAGRIKSVYLFAPDGIAPSFSNAIVTRSLVGKKIYGRILRNPSGLFRLVRFLEGARVLHPKLAAFVRESLATKEKREQVWNVWMCFRNIRPSASRVQQLINSHGIVVHLFFGAYDKIIPPSVGQKFARGLKQSDALHVVEAGHNLYKESVARELAKVVSSE